jgi:hypothetical protein
METSDPTVNPVSLNPDTSVLALPALWAQRGSSGLIVTIELKHDDDKPSQGMRVIPMHVSNHTFP